MRQQVKHQFHIINTQNEIYAQKTITRQQIQEDYCNIFSAQQNQQLKQYLADSNIKVKAKLCLHFQSDNLDKLAELKSFLKSSFQAENFQLASKNYGNIEILKQEIKDVYSALSNYPQTQITVQKIPEITKSLLNISPKLVTIQYKLKELISSIQEHRRVYLAHNQFQQTKIAAKKLKNLMNTFSQSLQDMSILYKQNQDMNNYLKSIKHKEKCIQKQLEKQ